MERYTRVETRVTVVDTQDQHTGRILQAQLPRTDVLNTGELLYHLHVVNANLSIK